jgi:hypothetical protein
MESLQLNSHPQVEAKFKAYPSHAGEKIEQLRNLILQTAKELEEIKVIEETLKWGEPAYLTKIGSTIRIDWKDKNPDQYAMYFNCSSQLVPTFRLVYQDLFEFEGKRAIIFQMDQQLPEKELKNCIATALTYHKKKNMTLLGM